MARQHFKLLDRPFDRPTNRALKSHFPTSTPDSTNAVRDVNCLAVNLTPCQKKCEKMNWKKIRKRSRGFVLQVAVISSIFPLCVLGQRGFPGFSSSGEASDEFFQTFVDFNSQSQAMFYGAINRTNGIVINQVSLKILGKIVKKHHQKVGEKCFQHMTV